VAPRIDQGLRTGRPARIAELDAAFSASIRGSDVTAIRLWNDRGVVIYSDDPRLMGERFPMPAPAHGGPAAAPADLRRPENRYLDPDVELVQVSLPLSGDDGSRYLFQMTALQDSIRDDAWAVWTAFAPVVAASMILLASLLVALGVRMARRISADVQAREDLLRTAVEASDRERRRIAADLHDGTVQNLAGLSFTLAGLAERAAVDGDAAAARTLDEAAGTSRSSVRDLRSLLVDIYPPNLETAGLAAAVEDLLACFGPEVAVEADLSEPRGLDQPTRAALYRIAREAVANTSRHAGATRVDVRLSDDAHGVLLCVGDDGSGFDTAAELDGHLGLRLMRDAAQSVGAELTVDSSAGSGTRVRVRMEDR
jgi:signal transduction histidine kinase